MAGDTFIESAGADNVHIGSNLENEQLVLDVLYVLPTGERLSQDMPNPGCPQQ